MKEKRRKLLALVLTLALLVTTVLTDVPQRFFAANSGNIQSVDNFKFYLNNNEIKPDSEQAGKVKVKDGDKIKVSFNWALPDNVSGVTVFEQQLDNLVSNLAFENVTSEDLPSVTFEIPNQGEVTQSPGKFSVNGGKMTITIDNQAFLDHCSTRSGGANLNATLDVNDSGAQKGDDVSWVVDGKKYTVIYAGNGQDSYADVSKTAGELKKDGDNYVQEYTVKLAAANGPITVTGLEDNPGSKLSSMSKISVVASDVDGVSAGTEYDNIAALNTAWGGNLAVKSGKSITLKYTMVVDPAVYNQEYADGFDNTLKLKYKSDNPDDQTEKYKDGWSNVNVNKPAIDKMGEVVGDNKDKVKWTVTIKLNDFTGIDNGKLIEVISDQPGTGLEAVDLSSITFNKKSDGVYEAVYYTNVTQDIISAGVTTELTNKINTKINGYDYSAQGTVTRTGNAWISKEVIGMDPNAKTIKWKVNVGPVPDNVSEVTVLDKLSDNNSTTHKWLSDLNCGHQNMGDIVISFGSTRKTIISGGSVQDGSIVSKYELSGMEGYQQGKIVFKDDFINNVIGNGNSFALEYTSKITDDNYAGRTYYNDAILSYKNLLNNEITTEAPAAAEWRRKNAIVKSSKNVEKKNQVTYSVGVNLDEIDLTPGEVVTVKDTFDPRMKLVSTPAALARDLLGDGTFVGKGGNSFIDYDPFKDYSSDESLIKVDCSTVDNVITMSFKIEEWMTRYKENKATNTWFTPCIVLEYTLEVKDQSDFTRTGSAITVSNSAEGTLDGDSIGADTSVIDISPADVADKNYKYNAEMYDGTGKVKGSYVAFEVAVNPNAIDLSETDTIDAVDTLGANSPLTYDIDSIEVYEIVNGSESKIGRSNYKISYDTAENSIRFVLPDEKALVIRYNALVDAYQITQTNATININNQFKISGSGADQFGDSVSKAVAVINPQVWIDGGQLSITLKKFWNNGEDMIALDGSEFELREISYKNGKWETVGETRELVFSANTTYEISQLNFDRYYELKEIKAKEGFTVNPEPYYFILPALNPTISTSCGGIEFKAFTSGTALYFENKPGISICKKDYETGQYVNNAELELYSVGADNSESLIGSWTTSQSNQILTFSVADATNFADRKLMAGTYILKEKTAPAGYLKAQEVKFELDAKGVLTLDSSVSSDTASVGSGGTALTMYDKSIKVYIHKVNDSDVNLAGATFELYQGSTKLGTVNSSATGAVMLDASKLKADGATVYTLKETVVPNNYKKPAGDVTFTVSATGSVQLTSSVEGISLEKNKTTDTVDNQIKVINSEITKISGRKIWKDNANSGNTRPASITVKLMRQGSVKPVATKEVTAADDWKYEFTDLPKYDKGSLINYSVTEESVEGYKISGGTSSDSYNLTNTLTGNVKVAVVKNWDDNNNSDKKRPASVTVVLKKNGATYVTQELNEANSWKHTWSTLDKYDSEGNEITYTVDENALPANSGYTKEPIPDAVASDGVLTFTITNSYEVQTTSIVVKKVWEHGVNPNVDLVGDVEIKLLKNGEQYGTKTMTKASGYAQVKWDNLPVFENGQKVTYSVLESAYDTSNSPLTDYVHEKPASSVSGNTTTYTFVNTYAPGKTTKTVTKVWDDDNNRDGRRPDEIRVRLLANGSEVSQTGITAEFTLNAANNWTHTWTGLDENFTYTVEELDTDGMLDCGYNVDNGGVPVITGDDTKSATITNTHVAEKVSVEVVKNWSGDTGYESSRPDVKVELYKNGVPTGETAILTAAGGWKYTWSDLYRYEDGAEIKYTVIEDRTYNADTLKNYGVIESVEPADASGVIRATIDNSMPSRDITVEKVWEDADNQDGKRPLEVVVELYRGDKLVGSKKLDAANQWTATWTKLPVKDYTNNSSGDDIVYTVKEVSVGGYETTYSPLNRQPNDTGKVTITNTHVPETTSIEVTKEWNDNDNQDGKRPDSVVAVLYKNGVPTTRVLELNDGNSWTGTFGNLPVYERGSKITYSVVEETVGEYQATYSPSDGIPGVDNKVTIINSYTPGKVSKKVIKSWNDTNDNDGKRPTSVKVQLYADGVESGAPQILNEANNWTYTWTALDEYVDGEKVIYSVDEIDCPEVYAVSQSTDPATQVTTITNTYVTEKTEFTVTKVWDDNNDELGNRPDSIVVQLYADGDPCGTAKTITKDDGWEYTWTDLNKYAAGKLIEYTAVEQKVKDYSATYSNVYDNKVTITNKSTPGFTNISVNKIWNDLNDADGLRPTEITVQLYANSVKSGDPVTLSVSEGWKYTWEKLPLVVDGKEVVYTVKEVNTPTGYTSSQKTDIAGNVTITNTHEQNTTSKSVNKVWVDSDNQDGIRPDNVKVQLYADGEAYGKPVSLSEKNDWSYVWNNIPLNKDGKKIAYTVEEVDTPDGYTSKVVENADGSATITNTHDIEMTKLTVVKKWKDSDNQDGVRPNAVKVQLYANGIPFGSRKILSDDNDWKYTWKELPKYAGGVEIIYTVKERKVVNYKAAYSELKDGRIVITNRYTPGKTSMSVTKVWNDSDDKDGIRPDSVTVQLYADGEAVGDEITLDDSNSWSYTWDGLDAKSDGEDISYTVKETDVPKGYKMSRKTDISGDVTITNTHRVNKKSDTDKSDSPQTGGSHMPIVTFVLMLISGMAIIIAKKKTEK